MSDLLEKAMRERDPLAAAKLDRWRDLKLGLMMHWGSYSVWGVVESWSLCSEDLEWTARTHGRKGDYALYKEDYRNLRKAFDPVHFDPAGWARSAADAGMKYLVFSTKHHDGFCMFDTRLTDYRITSADCPFHSHPKANVTREIFDAFRERGFMIGAYFSKPDWDCEYYWWPYFATPDRHVNYDPRVYPERWQKFKDFTFGQIEELMTGYGPVDILWLDGAWVRPLKNMPKEFEPWAKKKSYDQDIDMGRIAAMARRHQPGLIIVDRWVHGEFEDYETPEQRIPDKALDAPWESCITVGEGWSYAPKDAYKSVRELIRMLVDTVSKGGNLLLNVGPAPDGTWPEEVHDRLKGLGEWMKTNGEAIYGTRPVEPFGEGNVRFTRGKDGALYAVCLADAREENPPAEIRLSSIRPEENARMNLLGAADDLPWKMTEKGLSIRVPDPLRKDPPGRHAWVIRVSAVRVG